MSLFKIINWKMINITKNKKPIHLFSRPKFVIFTVLFLLEPFFNATLTSINLSQLYWPFYQVFKLLYIFFWTFLIDMLPVRKHRILLLLLNTTCILTWNACLLRYEIFKVFEIEANWVVAKINKFVVYLFSIICCWKSYIALIVKPNR